MLKDLYFLADVFIFMIKHMFIFIRKKGGYMKKVLFVLIVAMLCCQLANAEVYALFNKETGEGHGTVSINENYVADWAQKYILKLAGEEYRGKKGYEVKLEGGVLRLATQQEIDDYLAAQEQAQEDATFAKEKAKFLGWLDDEDVKTKVKDIKNL